MRNIRFKEITFMSYQGLARRISLDSDMIVIAGGNESGKSSILKSLYYTLGATVHPFARRWTDGHIVSMLKFSVDEINYKAVRLGNDVYLFYPDNSLFFVESDKTKIAANLGSLFGVNILYKDSKNKDKAFSTGYMFMPFYIDQDKGWDQPLNSFVGLSGIGGKQNAMLYHTGIIDDEYYVYKTKQEEAEKRKREVINELAGSLQFKKEAMKRFADSDILPFSIDDFNKGINEVLNKLSDLKEKQKKILQELEKLYSIKYSYQFNIDQLKDNINEINKDFKYALKSDVEICCPMCGATVENDAFARFKMLDDRDRCKDLLIDNNVKLDEIKEKITEKEKVSTDIKNEIDDLQAKINHRSEQVTLNEMFEAKLKEYIEDVVNQTTGKLFDEQHRLERIICENREKLKNLRQNDKKSMVEKDFDAYVKKFLRKFGIIGDGKKKHTLGGKVKSTGSNVVKYVFSYTYGYLHVMQKYGCPFFAPIVIDEPKQKGIDDNGFTSIINSIIQDRPKGSQLILSLTDSELYSINTEVSSIILPSGQDVLNKDEFDDVKAEIDDLIYDKGFRLS